MTREEILKAMIEVNVGIHNCLEELKNLRNQNEELDKQAQIAGFGEDDILSDQFQNEFDNILKRMALNLEVMKGFEEQSAYLKTQAEELNK